ncbi:hypothetical protein TNCV_2100201 [Trichonephila clavipes]|nr:hypothetical protein TNCV_2100201 [Trichonephila clavipes]
MGKEHGRIFKLTTSFPHLTFNENGRSPVSTSAALGQSVTVINSKSGYKNVITLSTYPRLNRRLLSEPLVQSLKEASGSTGLASKITGISKIRFQILVHHPKIHQKRTFSTIPPRLLSGAETAYQATINGLDSDILTGDWVGNMCLM